MADNEKTPLDEEQQKKLPELAEVMDLLKGIQAKQAQHEVDALDKDKLAKLTERVGELSTEFARRTQGRKAEWSTADAEEIIHNDPTAGRAMKSILGSVSKDPNILGIQEVMDKSYILSSALQKPITELKYFREKLDSMPILRKALTSADVGNAGVLAALTGWQPAEFSARMIEKVRLQLKVAALHQRIAMPADPYRFPVEGGDAQAYVVPEQGDADADLDTSKRVTTGLSATTATHVTLASKKVGTRVTLSNELDEDSFLPILDYLEYKIVLAMAQAQENVTINGDSAAALDTGGGGYVTNDQRRAWDGYRKVLQTLASKKTAGTATALDIADIRSVRAAMGKYGINPSDFVILCGPVGYVKLLGLKDGSNPSPVLTLEKYGPQATVITGELARVDGIPIIVTEFIGPNSSTVSGSENLNAQGTYDGVTSTYTEILFVRPSSFVYGDRRAATLASRNVIETDQSILVVLQRLTFANLYSGATVVGGVVGVSK